MSIIKFCLYIYLLLKPYYFFSSGKLQIGDFVLLFGFIFFLLMTKRKKHLIRETIEENKHYLIFLIFVFIINFVYYIIYSDITFIVSASYYLFNFFIILIFTVLINDEGFLVKLDKITKLNLFIQLILCIFKIGNNWSGTYRYMGTFNDPNQFAYFILISYCFLFLLKQKLNIKTNLFIYLIISIYLIVESTSTGMLVGIGIVSFLSIIDIFRNLPMFIKKNSKSIIISIYALITILVLGILLIQIRPELKIRISNILSDIKIVDRVSEKISKTNQKKGNDNIWHDRCYDIIFAYPKYTIYGAGQGNYSRFAEKTGHSSEIHATLPSILFYYGIIPTLILLAWLYKKLKNIPFRVAIIFIALFAESFTLLNQRQALFWIVILLGSTFKKTNNNAIN